MKVQPGPYNTLIFAHGQAIRLSGANFGISYPELSARSGKGFYLYFDVILIDFENSASRHEFVVFS